MQHIAGIDEAGRGPLAGPVVAAAVILPDDHGVVGLMDSKKLTSKRRELLFDVIKERALAYGIAQASAQEIDDINVLQASLLAMKRAAAQLSISPTCVLIDGLHCPNLSCETQAIVKGDQKIESISAASILAKVTRDRVMVSLDEQYPEYGFAGHKGYPTKAHKVALAQYGVTGVHRLSFAPVKALL